MGILKSPKLLQSPKHIPMGMQHILKPPSIIVNTKQVPAAGIDEHNKDFS